MSATDFEKNDGLDDLSSEELEARAFGPDTDAPRGAVRGLTSQPQPTALTVASATSWRVADPSDGRSRRALVLVAAAVALLTAGVALFATAGPDADQAPIVETYDEIDFVGNGETIDDSGIAGIDDSEIAGIDENSFVGDGDIIGNGEIIEDIGGDGDIVVFD